MSAAARRLLRISRPRFWLYLGGTYLVGYTAGAEAAGDFARPAFWLLLAYFLLPANLYLYGVNDLADEDTDHFNPKKGTREHRLLRTERRTLALAVGASGALGLALLPLLPRTDARVFLLAFLVLGAAYSLPPPRLKARPFLDSASNVLYAMPAFLGFVQAGGGGVPIVAAVGAAAWTAAMHLFSAVPDIEADRAAGLRTTATVLGARPALALCAGLWAVAAGSAVWLLSGAWVAWAALVYPAVALLVLARPVEAERVYWAFPYLNGLAGFGLFVVAASRWLA